MLSMSARRFSGRAAVSAFLIGLLLALLFVRDHAPGAQAAPRPA